VFPSHRGLGEKPPAEFSGKAPETCGLLALGCLQEGQNLRLLGILQTVHNSKNRGLWLNEKES